MMTGTTQIVSMQAVIVAFVVAIAVFVVKALRHLRLVILASRDTVAACGPGSDGARQPRVAAVVITLNEARQIEQCLEHLLACRPPFEEVLVCDGGSTDETVDIVKRIILAGEMRCASTRATCLAPAAARQRQGPGGRQGEPGRGILQEEEQAGHRGAKRDSKTGDRITEESPTRMTRTRIRIITSSTKGRAAQLNTGARAVASGSDAVVFVHADSRPPPTCVQDVRMTLFNDNDPHDPTDIGLLGFPTRIAMFDETGRYSPASETRILWLTTIHEYISYFFYPLLFQPLSYLRGLRCLFGDQNLALRTADVIKLGGYDDALRIMEDLDLC